MIKNNVSLKNSLDLVDKIKMTNELADSYFHQNTAAGEWEYTPCFADVNIIAAFFLYCVDGLEFEPLRYDDGTYKMDDNGNPLMESVYELVIKDSELFPLYTDMMDAANTADAGKFEAYEHKTLLTQFLSVLADVTDMVEFRKQQLLHQKRDSVDVFFAALADMVKSVDLSGIDFQSLMENVWQAGSTEKNETANMNVAEYLNEKVQA